MRLIDADTLREVLKSNGLKDFLVYMFIDQEPTVDAEPIRHGHWIDTGSGQECSVCGEIQYGYDNGRYYCPNCGAKMDKEQ